MNDEDAAMRAHRMVPSEEESKPKLWNCTKCGYEGRVRTRLNRGLTRLDWIVVCLILSTALVLLIMNEKALSILSLVLIILAGIYFAINQFKPATTYKICPLCKKKFKAPKEDYIPLIPTSNRSKKKRQKQR